MGSMSFSDVWDTSKLDIPREEVSKVLLQEFPGVSELQLNGISMFMSMLGHVTYGVTALLLLSLTAIGFGTLYRRFFPKEGLSISEQVLLLLGLGLSTLIFVLLLLAVFGLLGVTVIGVPMITLLFLAVCVFAVFREGKFLYRTLTQKYELSWSRVEGYIQPFFIIGLLLVTAATFLHLLRPIPIGWDDIGVYMNVPSLTAQHGGLVGGFGSYNWGLIMSLGFLVWNTPYIAMLYSFAGGLLAFFGLYVLIRACLPKGEKDHDEEPGASIPLFLVTTFAMSPFVLFQLGEDMKIDLGLLFIATVATFIGILLWRNEKLRRPSWYLILGGVLGIALGIKLTAVLLAIMVLGLLVTKFIGGWGLAALTSFSVMVLLAGNIFSMGGLVIPEFIRLVLLCSTAVIGIVSTVKAFLTKGEFQQAVKLLLISVLGVLLSFSPWFAFNIQSWCTNGCPPPSITLFLYSRSSQPLLPLDTQLAAGNSSAEIAATSSGTVLTDSVELKETLQSEGGSVTEELGRYAGFGESIAKYISLPFDTTFSVNVMGDYVTVGWVFLALFFLAGLWALTQYAGTKVFSGLLTTLILPVLIILLEYLGRLPDVAPWQLHTTTLLIGSAFLWGIARIGQQGAPLKNASLITHMALLTVIYIFLWMYVASGVVWYGITGITGILILAGVALYQMAQNKTSRVHYRIFIILLLLLWIIPMYAYKLTTSETSIKVLARREDSLVTSQKAANSFDTRYFSLFKAGVLNQKTGLQYFNAEYFAASELLNKETDSKIYRVGTLLPYFVRSNDTRMAADNQLDQFIATYLPKGDSSYLLTQMYEAGFRYIVFDLGTDSIDKTTEQTLTKKVDIFQSFINGDAVGTAPRDARGERSFTGENSLLKEELRASSFIIWSINPPRG